MVPDAEIMSGSQESRRIVPPGQAGCRWGKRHRRARGQRPQRLIALVASGIALAIAPPGAALAAEGDLYVVLHYSVDASAHGCWDEAEFRRGVAHRIGYEPFRDDAGIEVRVHVGGSVHAVDGHVEWRKASGLLMGERRFVAKDGNCAKLLTEMSFAVGLQIELLRPKPPAGPGPVAGAASGSAATGATGGAAAGTAPAAGGGAAAPAGHASTTTSPPPTGPPAPAARQENPGERREPKKPSTEDERSAAKASPHAPMWVGLGPSLAWRLAPALTTDARLFVGIRLRDLSLEIAAEGTYPSTDKHWDGSGFRQSLIGGTLAFCGHHDVLSACALGRVSQVRVTGVGVDNPRSPNAFIGQAGVRLAGAFSLGRSWFIALHLDLLGLLTPCKVELNQATVWEIPRLGGLGGVDLLLHFR
jgi:hypothetical protein